MITAAVFDMDGLLIDSEPLWREAMVDLFNKIGVPMTEKMCRETMGMRIDEVIAYWYMRYPWEGVSHKEAEDRLYEAIVMLVKEKGIALPGVGDALALMRKSVAHVALASSSKYVLIDTVVDKLAIRDFFDVIYSAEDEPLGKPHPGIYISTAQQLGVTPMECLAFEDSPNGVLAAKAAKMKCVAVPEEGLRGDQRFAIADRTLDSLAEFNEGILKDLSS